MNFKWEPVVWLAALQSILAVLVAIPSLGIISGDAAAWILTATSAVFAAVEAFMVRPMTPAALTGAIRTALTALMLFGLPISEELSLALVALGTMILGLMVRNGVSPKEGQVLAWENSTVRMANKVTH
jgi:hypothetical protein